MGTPLRAGDAAADRARWRRQGYALEALTLAWNVAAVAVLAVAAVSARSVALAGFGLDSLIEIGASTVVLWALAGTAEHRQRVGVRLIGVAFALLAVYLGVQSTWVLVAGQHARRSLLGIGWTAATVGVMAWLAAAKRATGRALGDPVLRHESRVTLVDAVLAAAVLAAIVLDAVAGWWWAEPLAGYVIVIYGAREARAAWAAEPEG